MELDWNTRGSLEFDDSATVSAEQPKLGGWMWLLAVAWAGPRLWRLRWDCSDRIGRPDRFQTGSEPIPTLTPASCGSMSTPTRIL